MGAKRRGAYQCSVCVCVCCNRWPWQWEAGREDGSNSAPARARPTCGCTRRVSAPWPAFIFRAQRYIGMIANVWLICLLSLLFLDTNWQSNLNIYEIERQHEDTQVEKNPTKFVCVVTSKLHMKQKVAVFLWHSATDKTQGESST